jgi:hypothetical protein
MFTTIPLALGGSFKNKFWLFGVFEFSLDKYCEFGLFEGFWDVLYFYET